MNINPLFLKDYYKVDHISQYPPGTTLIFNNFTPRKSKVNGINHSVFFGLQYFIKRYLNGLITYQSNHDHIYHLIGYQYLMEKTLGLYKRYEHIEKLLKYIDDNDSLPIKIYALPELSVVPCGVPAMVMFNTHPDFFWLPNMLETLLSCSLWQTCTSATIARQFRLLLDKFAERTSDIPEFVDYQAHDFSMRGMSSVESAALSGMAHLQYFLGSDSIPALIFNHEYYGKELHIASVAATEHSTVCSNIAEIEISLREKGEWNGYKLDEL